MDWKRIGIFLAFAFGIAWAAALVIYLTGGLTASPIIIPAINLSLAGALLAVVYMGAPALAHLLTRLVTAEGWGSLYLHPKFKQGWRFWAAAWVLPGLLTIFGMAVYFLVFPQHFDPSLKPLTRMLASSPAPLPFSPWVLVILQTGMGILISPLVNGLFTFGEEFGWRAYLQPKLMPLGGRKAMLLLGVIWGVWHWPVILMGYEYGFDYWGFPWSGLALFLLFTIASGTLLGWVTLRGGSVWGAVIGHAGMNGIAALAVVMTQGSPSPLLGPLPVGLVGMLGYILWAAWILVSPGELAPEEKA